MKTKKAKNTDDAWNIQHRHKGSEGWIQWKGTEVCMDVYCICGCSSHIDASFAYHIQCPKCKRIYFCNGHIELIELEEHDVSDRTIIPYLDEDQE